MGQGLMVVWGSGGLRVVSQGVVGYGAGVKGGGSGRVKVW